MGSEIETYRRMLKQTEQQYQDLLAKHSGVRPSWVSEELCHMEMRIANYKYAIDELQNEAGYTAYGERPECDFDTPKGGI